MPHLTKLARVTANVLDSSHYIFCFSQALAEVHCAHLACPRLSCGTSRMRSPLGDCRFTPFSSKKHPRDELHVVGVHHVVQEAETELCHTRADEVGTHVVWQGSQDIAPAKRVIGEVDLV